MLKFKEEPFLKRLQLVRLKSKLPPSPTVCLPYTRGPALLCAGSQLGFKHNTTGMVTTEGQGHAAPHGPRVRRFLSPALRARTRVLRCVPDAVSSA